MDQFDFVDMILDKAYYSNIYKKYMVIHNGEGYAADDPKELVALVMEDVDV